MGALATERGAAHRLGLKPLPNQAGMRVAIRQCLRVGPRAGALLEDFGVVPDADYRPTRDDVMEGYKGSGCAAEFCLRKPRAASR